VCTLIIIKGSDISNRRYTFRKNSHLNSYFTANHEGENSEQIVKKHNRRGEQVKFRMMYKAKRLGRRGSVKRGFGSHVLPHAYLALSCICARYREASYKGENNEQIVKKHNRRGE